MILVTGATGTVGRTLIAQLLTAGHTVRACSRRPDTASLPAQVEIVADDLDDAAATAAAFDGIDQVFLLSSGTALAHRDARITAAARAAGTRGIVKLSILSAGYDDSPDPITRWHRNGEQAVRTSGLRWTFLRPTAFMSNTLGWADSIAAEHTVYAPFGTGRTAVVDPDDVAAVAATVLADPDDHHGRAYPLTGPEALSPERQVAILSSVLGRPLAYRDVPPAAARAAMLGAGLPPDVADGVLALLASGIEPRSAIVHPTVENILGRPASSFQDWVRRHRDAFLGPT